MESVPAEWEMHSRHPVRGHGNREVGFCIYHWQQVTRREIHVGKPPQILKTVAATKKYEIHKSSYSIPKSTYFISPFLSFDQYLRENESKETLLKERTQGENIRFAKWETKSCFNSFLLPLRNSKEIQTLARMVNKLNKL